MPGGRPGKKGRGQYRFGSKAKHERTVIQRAVQGLNEDIRHMEQQRDSINTTSHEDLLFRRDQIVRTLRKFNANDPQARILSSLTPEQFRRYLTSDLESKIEMKVKRLKDEFGVHPSR